MTKADKEFVHGLVERYYTNRIEQAPRELCIGCGEPRVLGERGQAKGKCKACRKNQRAQEAQYENNN